MTVTSLFPVLRTADLPRLRGFYEAALGAELTYCYDQDGIDVYVSLAVGGGSLGIGFEADVPRGEAIAVWFYSDDVDAAYGSALAAGAASVLPPEDMPWGERVAQVRDPDGNLLYLATATPS
ncbi:VOC family protein [Microbacterium sp. SA39]|uniref:VOC family protein n=1 Tax=Microbacterium sp. SA39 TaxID=1263625 RepID=UPI0005F9AB0E|nr:VOC family protein [Microbacterium sp. SA39]KJQ53495.1 Glyoxalase-like domain protein [Microbacterium sp. SA39]